MCKSTKMSPYSTWSLQLPLWKGCSVLRPRRQSRSRPAAVTQLLRACRLARKLLTSGAKHVSGCSAPNHRHGSLNLLIAHKHHNVPGTQAEKRRHESTTQKKNKKTTVIYFLSVMCVMLALDHVPLIESCGALFNQHSQGTADGAAVLPRHWIHVARLHHIHWRRHHGGAEACCEGRCEVTGHVVCWKGIYFALAAEGHREHHAGMPGTIRRYCDMCEIPGDECEAFAGSPVIRWCFRMSSLMMSYVTSSEQFTMELRAMFGRQPERQL